LGKNFEKFFVEVRGIFGEIHGIFVVLQFPRDFYTLPESPVFDLENFYKKIEKSIYLEEAFLTRILTWSFIKKSFTAKLLKLHLNMILTWVTLFFMLKF
jgi:hypothetical protein